MFEINIFSHKISKSNTGVELSWRTAMILLIRIFSKYSPDNCLQCKHLFRSITGEISQGVQAKSIIVK